VITARDRLARARQFNWLTFFAILCVAVTSGFIMRMAIKLTDTLASPDWCGRAIQAEKLTGTRSSSSCVDLMKLQLGSLALDNHIYAMTLAVCVGVLVVVVLAKARLDLEASKDGLKGSVEGQSDAVPVQVANGPDNPVPVAPAGDQQ
jgi:hypothetical protein